MVSGAAYHIASRFLDKRYRMVDDFDRQAYLQHTALAAARCDLTFLSFALMSTHVHHSILGGADPLARFVQSAHTRFARHWHDRHGGLGPVFANRPSSWHVPQDRLLRLIAYHHRNPVDAGVVTRPAESHWTSHRCYLRLDPSPPWLNVERGLELMGFSDNEAGRRQFDEFVCDVNFDEPPWHVDIVDSPKIFADPSTSGPSVAELIHEFTQVHQTSLTNITRRSRPTHPARIEFIRFALTRGVTQGELAEKLDVARSTISKLAVR